MNQTRLQLIAAEPYRVFFPVAILVSIIGVLLWPLVYGGYLAINPTYAHPRLMIEGFVGGFAIGFLGTALPKMFAVKPFRTWQVSLMLALYLSYCTAHTIGKIALGDTLFALTMIILIGCVIPRILARKKLPPPGMVLSGIGILCGVFGAAWGAWFTNSSISPYLLPFSQRLLYQAFILLPILGVGSFMIPMILNVEKNDNLSANAWRWKAIEAAVVGILIIASYWIEVMGYPKAMSWCRFGLAGYWLALETGCFKPKSIKLLLKDGIMPNGLRAGVYCVVLALLATAVLQKNKIALDHMLYVGGFGLISMIVATRVIFGHSGQAKQFQKWLKPLTAAVALLLLGMATRVSADFIPNLRISHHVYAAICWVGVCIIWGIAIIPSVRKTPPKKPQTIPQPKKSPIDLMDMSFRK